MKDDTAIELTVEKLVPGGFGLGRRNDGKVVLVRGGFPGDRLRARIVRRYRRYDIGVAQVVSTPSQWRVDGCPHFPRCGGCSLSGLDPEKQRESKRAWLEEALTRALRGEIPPITITASPLHYRLVNRFHRHSGSYGFRAWRSHDTVPIDGCRLISPLCLDYIGSLARGPDIRVTLEDPAGTAIVGCDPAEAHPPALSIDAGDYRYRVHAGRFFQPNRHLLGRFHGFLSRIRLEHPPARALDLYAGVGFLTLPLAGMAERVTAVEISRRSVEDLAFNTARWKEIEVVRSDSASYLARGERFDLVVADPPRSGLGEAVVRGITASGASDVILFSCDPATFARDMKIMAETASFEILALEMIDQFPETHHVETAVHLRLTGAPRTGG